jgi:hypothetical protein
MANSLPIDWERVTFPPGKTSRRREPRAPSPTFSVSQGDLEAAKRLSKQIIARYSTICRGCNDEIAAGRDSVSPTSNRGWVHTRCLFKAQVSPGP